MGLPLTLRGSLMAKMMIAFSGRQEASRGSQARNVNVQGEQIYDPGKFMPSSPVSPGTPEQPGHVKTPQGNERGERGARNALARIGFIQNHQPPMEGKINIRRNEYNNTSMEARGESNAMEQMKRSMKRMSKRMDHMEKGSAEGFAKGGEIMYGGEVLKKLPQVARKASKIIKNYPETWDEYLEEEDYQGIFEMESKELEKAMEEGEKKDLEKECSHVLAALMLMCVAECEEE